MKLSKSAQFARGYLFFIAWYYLLMGILLNTGNLMHGFLFVGPLIILLFGGWFLLVYPIPISSNNNLFQPTPPDILFLNYSVPILAIIFGMVAIAALVYLRYSIKWIIVWYGLSILAFLILLWNVSILNSKSYVSEMVAQPAIFSLINASLFLGATIVLHRGTRYRK